MSTRRLLGTLVFVFLCSGPAFGATLTMTADQATYAVGDTITLTIVGDAEGAAEPSFFGFVGFGSLVAWESTTQVAATTLGVEWPGQSGAVPVCNSGLTPGICPAFDQIWGVTSATPDAPVLSTMKFTALATGVASFDMPPLGSDPFQALFFFDLGPVGPSTQVLIVTPEPGTGLMLALGLCGVAVRRRKERPTRSS